MGFSWHNLVFTSLFSSSFFCACLSIFAPSTFSCRVFLSSLFCLLLILPTLCIFLCFVLDTSPHLSPLSPLSLLFPLLSLSTQSLCVRVTSFQRRAVPPIGSQRIKRASHSTQQTIRYSRSKTTRNRY